jgi:hypothetical protein
MTKGQQQDPVELMKSVLRNATLDLIASNRTVTAHQATESAKQHFPPLGYSHDSDELYLHFVASFVHAVHAEERLRQHIEAHPDEGPAYMNAFKGFPSR